MTLHLVFADDSSEALSTARYMRSVLAYNCVTSAYLEALPDARGLYEKHGFVRIPPKPGKDEVISTMVAKPK